MKTRTILMTSVALMTIVSVHLSHGKEGTNANSFAVPADVLDTLKENKTEAALHVAALQGHTEKIRRLIADGADPNRQLSSRNWAPLHFAAWADSVDATKELLTGGADVDLLAQPARGREIRGPSPGQSPLDMASEQGSVRVAEVLLANKANIDANPEESKQSALHRATNGLYRTRDEYLRINKLGEISFGNAEMIELLIKYGASLRQPDYRGNLPLHVAVNAYAAETISYLLDKHRDQIDIEAPGEFQRSPLLMAVEGAVQHRKGEDPEPIRREVIRLLVENGADPNRKSGFGGMFTSPLEAAKRKGLSAEIMELLTVKK